MKFCVWILAIVLLSSCVALADDDAGGKVEITIFSGWSFIDASRQQQIPVCFYCLAGNGAFSPYTSYPSFETRVKGSPLVGFSVGTNINRNMEVEGSFALAPDHHVESTYPPIAYAIACVIGVPCPPPQLFPPQNQHMVSYQYEASFVYNLLGGNTRPYLTFGVGGITSDMAGDVNSNFAFNFGGGAKFYFRKNLGLRLEVNDHVLPNYFLNDKTEHDVQLHAGFLFSVL